MISNRSRELDLLCPYFDDGEPASSVTTISTSLHAWTPPPATTDKCRTRRYTNTPLGTKHRSGHVSSAEQPIVYLPDSNIIGDTPIVVACPADIDTVAPP